MNIAYKKNKSSYATNVYMCTLVQMCTLVHM